MGDAPASGVAQQLQIRAPGVEDLTVPGLPCRLLDVGEERALRVRVTAGEQAAYDGQQPVRLPPPVAQRLRSSSHHRYLL
ncbi:hypothetical protein [Streptomyces violaceus]|uniref:hypothetical protein n=1 Tax=Streptomyces violaceus TaxID=1936 RepID=UPI00399D76D3